LSATSPDPFLSGADSIGTIPSALVTYAAIQALQPDLIINAGTTGGFKVGTAFSPSNNRLRFARVLNSQMFVLYFRISS